jgi:putative tryptophan/tyrosine transport system substrate-binding protein
MTGGMGRRSFLAALGGATAAWPLAVRAQQAGRMYRVGSLGVGPEVPVIAAGYPAFRDELRKHGFIDGRNLAVESRPARLEISQYYADAAELVRSNVDLIVAVGSEIAVKAALAATTTIPIVMWAVNYDPIAHGYVQSLARPGGNVTGVFTRQLELAAKQVEILKQTFPERTRLAALWDDLSADQFAAVASTAQALRLDLHALKLEQPPYDIAAAFRRLAKDDPQMLLAVSSPLFGPHIQEIVDETNRRRLPAMFIFRNFVEQGGLISYGVDIKSDFRRLAEYVAKIFNGAQPADLPVEQPTKFELLVNLRTAKAIGVDLPTSLLLRADEVIE